MTTRREQRWLRKLTLTLCVLAGVAGRASHAQAQSRVEGVVRFADGAPAPGVTIRLEGLGLPAPLVTTSDARGLYVFAQVKSGTWSRLIATLDGRPVGLEPALISLVVERINITIRRQSSTPESAEDLDPMGGPATEVRGIVRSADGSPISNATLMLGDGLMAATTDAFGRYSFGTLRAGLVFDVQATAEGFAASTAHVEVASAGNPGADFTLRRDTTTPALHILRGAGDDGTLVARPDHFSRVASLGVGDLFRGLQFTPATLASVEASSSLFVRGGTPGQTLITLGGFTLYPVAHLLGTLSALNIDAIDVAEFSPTAVNAADGGHLAGTLRLRGLSNADGKPTAFFETSGFGVTSRVSTPLGSHVSLLVAGRHSAPGIVSRGILDRLTNGSVESQGSEFQDVNANLDAAFTPGNRVSFNAYDGRDRASTARNVSLPAETSTITVPGEPLWPSDAVVQVRHTERWTAHGAGATWRRQWSPALDTIFSAGYSKVTKVSDQRAPLVGATDSVDYSWVSGRGSDNAIAESNTVRDTTLRVVATFRPNFAHVLSGGGESVFIDTAYGAAMSAADSASQVRTAALADRALTGRSATAFLQDAWRATSRLTVSPGARLTNYDLTAKTYLDPRVSATYLATPIFRVTAAWAMDHQTANRIVREDRLRGDGTFWTIADGTTIPVARGRQATIGGLLEIPGWLFHAALFDKQLDDLAMLAPRILPGVAPDGSSSLWHIGSSHARGAELLVQYDDRRHTVSAGYSLGRVTDRYPTLEAAAFPASHDQRQEVKVLDTVRVRTWWRVSGAFVAGLGRPYTAIGGTEAVWLPSGASASEIAFGSKNGARLPSYRRVDVSSSINLHVRSLQSSFGATLFNVLDQGNVAFRGYESVGTTPIANDVLLMGRTLSGFLRFGF